MPLKYNYNPTPDTLDFDSSGIATNTNMCIELNTESAIDLLHVDAATDYPISFDAATLAQVITDNGVLIGYPFILSGTVKQLSTNVARPIIITQTVNGVPSVVGYGQSRANDGGFTLGVQTLSSEPCVAISHQDYGVEFSALKAVVFNDVIRPTEQNGFVYHALNTGTLGAVEPEWPTEDAEQITSGDVTLVAVIYYQPVAHAPVEIAKNFVSGVWPSEVYQADTCPVFDPDSFVLNADVRAQL